MTKVSPSVSSQIRKGAENHCNVGNGKLALDTIDCWLTGLRRRDED